MLAVNNDDGSAPSYTTRETGSSEEHTKKIIILVKAGLAIFDNLRRVFASNYKRLEIRSFYNVEIKAKVKSLNS